MLSGCESSSLPLSSCRCVSRAQRRVPDLVCGIFGGRLRLFLRHQCLLRQSPGKGCLPRPICDPRRGEGWAGGTRAADDGVLAARSAFPPTEVP